MSLYTKYVFAVVILICLYEIFSLLKKDEIISKTKDKTNKIIDTVQQKLGRKVSSSRKKLDTMNSYEKSKSKYYMYHKSMYAAIMDMHMQEYTNVETLALFLGLISIVIGQLFTYGLGMFTALLFTVVIFVCLNFCVLLYSRGNSVARAIAIMDAMDLICSDMSSGFNAAVKNNIDVIDPMISPVFKEYLIDRMEFTLPLDRCVETLNLKLGSRADKFCETVLSYERSGEDSLLDSFKSMIKTNSRNRIAYKDMLRDFKTCIKYYVVCVLAVTAMMVIVNALFGLPLAYFLTPVPRIIVLMMVVTALGGFIWAELILTEGV